MKTKDFYIKFLNKNKQFRLDVKEFTTYEKAMNWAKKNLEKFHPDMIKVK